MKTVLETAVHLIDEGGDVSISKIARRCNYSRTAIQARVGSSDALKGALWVGLAASLISLGGFRKFDDTGFIQSAPVIKSWVVMFPYRFRYLVENDPPMHLITQAEACFLRFTLLLVASGAAYELTTDDELHLRSLAEKVLTSSPFFSPPDRGYAGEISVPLAPWKLKDADPLAGGSCDLTSILYWAQIEFDNHTLLPGGVDMRPGRFG